MKIAIDISQATYADTGVANFIKSFVEGIIYKDRENEYILFYSSLRKKIPIFAREIEKKYTNVSLIIRHMPPSMLDVIWNRLHIRPIEDFVGSIDVFISSDWTQPPVKNAINITILFDLIVYRYPEETHAKIVQTQRRRLNWVKKECDLILCISESTRQDAIDILGIDDKRLRVVYPGILL